MIKAGRFSVTEECRGHQRAHFWTFIFTYCFESRYDGNKRYKLESSICFNRTATTHPTNPGGGGCLSSIKCGGDGVYQKGAEKKPGLEAEDAAVSGAYWRVSLAL